ncbi:hypothetical protein DDZ13_06580 [Coraliomargarita sinensis]|uniref:Uncharacterized protein n=1 Tax=Coraliomargarita sinensis TaxID=2174842 RepID=A0A317ZGU7_9BACT|nr:hypothetical protein DDZ13_06580 [Coraliomargarita sinensis]
MFPFSSAASGLGFGGGPAVASSGGPFAVGDTNFGGVDRGTLDQKTALIISAGIITAVVIYGITKR